LRVGPRVDADENDLDRSGVRDVSARSIDDCAR
jgi:hypothetical protein